MCVHYENTKKSNHSENFLDEVGNLKHSSYKTEVCSY